MHLHLAFLRKLVVVTIIFVSTILIHEIFIPIGWSSEVLQQKGNSKSFVDYEEKVLDLEARAKSLELSARTQNRYLDKIEELGILIKSIDHSFSNFYQSSMNLREKEIKSICRNIEKLEKEIIFLERKFL